MKLQKLKTCQKVAITEVSVEDERIKKVKISSDYRVERRILTRQQKMATAIMVWTVVVKRWKASGLSYWSVNVYR